MKAFLEAISKLLGFRLAPKGVWMIILGGVIGFGVDYLLNPNRDYRLMIFTIGLSIIIVFIINRIYVRMKYHYATRKAINKLTQEECEYVLSCEKEDNYIEFDFSNTFQVFKLKWRYILYVPTAEYLVSYERYKICVHKKAFKLVKKKMDKMNQKSKKR